MADAIEERDRGPWWVVGAGLIGGVVLTIAYVRFRTGFPVGTLEAHAEIGDALGPATAFLTLLAVVAALWSVQIQRVELALQRQELRETREEMVEQRKQFERTAKAQERLADSQLLLAEAQVNANREAACLRLAQHSNTIATMDAALASLDAGSLVAYALKASHSTIQTKNLEERRQAIGNRIDRELKMEEALQVLLTHGAIHVPLTVAKEDRTDA